MELIMIDIELSNVYKEFAGIDVLRGVNLKLKSNERVGLIGQNGTGKTTILKIITGKESHNAGCVTLRKDLVLGYLDQIPCYDNTYSVLGVLQEAFAEVISLQKKMRECEQQMEIHCDEKVMKSYGYLQEKFDALGGYEMENELDRICSGLNIDHHMRARCFNTLSGGEKTTVVLAKLLLQKPKPDVLLLDEPTNHLDIKAIEWLERYLIEFAGSLLVISHDRYFLDTIVTRIAELEYGVINDYVGNYSFYIKEKELREFQEFEEYKDRQKKIKALREAAKRYRVWGTINSDNSSHMARAKRYEKAADELEAIDKPKKKREITISVTQGDRSGNDVLSVKNISKAFTSRNILTDLSMNILYKDKVALLGANGCGKSTLLKMLLGQYTQDSGDIKMGASLAIGYMEQEIEFSNSDSTVLDTFRNEFALHEGLARSKLARFHFFRDDVYKKVKSLSGGEKARLRLCIILNRDINFLILDEPTNHLDIDSRENLEKALIEFPGTILFISHDRYFINKLCTKIYEINNGRAFGYEGNYDFYKEQINSQIAIKTESKNKPTNQSKTIQKRDDNKLKNQENKQKSIMLEIEELEARITLIEEKMLAYANDYVKLQEEEEKKRHLELKLSQLYQVWEEMELL